MKKLTVKEIIEDLNNLSLGDIADSILLSDLIVEYEKRLEKENNCRKEYDKWGRKIGNTYKMVKR